MASGEIGQPLRHHISDSNLWIPHGGGLTNEVLGRMQCAQANDPAKGIIDPSIWNAGQAYIRPEIVPWPFSVDELGTTFDQANLWGVRFNAYNPALNSLVAVPRLLPNGYTASIARGQWQSDRPVIAPAYYSDDGKATWKTGVTSDIVQPGWSLRAPPGSVSPARTWGPMNFANKSCGAATADYNTIRYHIDIPTITSYTVTITNRAHIGYRGAKISIYDFTTAYSGAAPISVHVGWKPAGVTLTGWPDMPTELWSHTWSDGDITEFSPNPLDPTRPNTYGRADYVFSLTPPNALGNLVDYYAWLVVPGGWSPLQHVMVTAFSPRTDVPFWFDTVGINDGVSSDWHAPGGYIP